jgi:ribosomal protein S18 acetylase RimI-like enzyme
MEIREMGSGADLGQIKLIFRQYFSWITEDNGFKLSYQRVEVELDNLPGSFSPPEGCLLIAEIEGNPVGCVALRSFEPGICEMKRLFVKPECRGKRLGSALAKKVIQEAKNKGYHKMLLDTGDFMVAAQGLYRSLGFKTADQYYDVPAEALKRTVFMELSLDGTP